MYRILIVEDDPGVAEAICTRAAMWQLKPHCVRDMRNVMAEFAEVQPHLVLMDITLPFMSGYHWCGQIRAVSSVPIIFISSASDNMNIIMAMNMGADDFIAKPFDGDVLIAKLQALLRRTYDFGGTVTLDGKDISLIKESELAKFRRDSLGFVFQEFNLLDNFTIEDNVFLPLVLAGKSYDEMHSRIVPVANELGITQHLERVLLHSEQRQQLTFDANAAR